MRSNDGNLLNDIEDIYGKDAVMIIGDCDAKTQQKHMISTPGIGLVRKVAQRFPVYRIDEFRTSCLNHITEERCKNLYLPNEEGIQQKIHSVLTYKMNNGRHGVINRDKNAVNNMRKITNSYLYFKERPYKYRREVKVD